MWYHHLRALLVFASHSDGPSLSLGEQLCGSGQPQALPVLPILGQSKLLLLHHAHHFEMYRLCTRRQVRDQRRQHPDDGAC